MKQSNSRPGLMYNWVTTISQRIAKDIETEMLRFKIHLNADTKQRYICY